MKIKVKITGETVWAGQYGYIVGGHALNGSFAVKLLDGTRLNFFGSEIIFVEVE